METKQLVDKLASVLLGNMDPKKALTTEEGDNIKKSLDFLSEEIFVLKLQ